MSNHTTAPPIGQADGANPCLHEAIRLLKAGFWPVAIHPPDSDGTSPGKRPIGKNWGATRPTESRLRAIWQKTPGASVGLKLGPDGGVIDIEVDDPEVGPESLERLLGTDSIETLGWSSRRGSHLLFRWDERLAAFENAVYHLADFPGIEVRLGGPDKQTQSVIPPSPTTSEVDGKTVVGAPRKWNDCDAIAPLPESVIKALHDEINPKPTPIPEGPGHPFWMRATGRTFDPVEAYGRKAIEDAVQKVERAQEGKRRTILNNEALGLGQLVASGAISRMEAEVALSRAASKTNLPPEEITRTIQDALDDGAKSPRDLSEIGKAKRNGKAATPPVSPTVSPDTPPAKSRLSTTCGASLKAKPVRFLAKGRVAIGCMTLFGAEGGAGKTTLTIHLAACVTTGRPPFGESELGYVKGPADVLILGNEDGQSEVYLPRLLAAGADMRRIHFVNGVDVASQGGKAVPFTFLHSEALRNELELRPDVRLLVIDPVGTLAGRSGLNDNRNAELAASLEPLADVARDRGIAVVLVAHLNKGTTSKAVHRVIGSAAYVNSCRAAYVIANDPEDDGTRIFSAVKFNVGKIPKSLRYTIESPPDSESEQILCRPEFSDLEDEDRQLMREQMARIVWRGETDRSADDCLSSNTQSKAKATKVDQARPWLLDLLLKAGPEGMPSDEVFAAGKALGFKRDLLFRLREDLPQISARKAGFSGGWKWVLDPSYSSYASDSSYSSDSSDSSNNSLRSNEESEGSEGSEASEASEGSERHSRKGKLIARHPFDVVASDGGAMGAFQSAITVDDELDAFWRRRFRVPEAGTRAWGRCRALRHPLRRYASIERGKPWFSRI